MSTEVKPSERALNEYVKQKHTQEECIGFIDGFTLAGQKIEELQKELQAAHLMWANRCQLLRTENNNLKLELYRNSKECKHDYIPNNTEKICTICGTIKKL